MKLSEERIQEMKVLLEKEKGVEVSYEEASEASYNLAGLAEILFDCWLKDEQKKKKLKEFPKGFHIEGVGYTCVICGNSFSNEETWYDKWGNKCIVCQKAIDKKIIPGSCVKNNESWYSKYDLESRFNIDRHALKKFINKGILKPRIVPNENGKPRAQLFLIKDHKDTLPPKKMTESKMVKETKDGKDWYRSEPWYRFVDPFEYLKEYKIMNHMRKAEPKNK